MQKKFGKDRACGAGDILADRQTDTHTHTHTDIILITILRNRSRGRSNKSLNQLSTYRISKSTAEKKKERKQKIEIFN